MSTTKDGDSRDPIVAARVPEELKRKTDIRARELGLNTTEYLRNLIEDDLSNAPYLDEIDFE